MSRLLRLKTKRLENNLCRQWATANGWASPEELAGFVEVLVTCVRARIQDPKGLQAISEELPRAAEQWKQRRMQ